METPSIMTKPEPDDVSDRAEPLLPEPLYQGLCTWYEYSYRLHLYREQVEPLLIGILDSNPAKSQRAILEVILHCYRMVYFEQESQYAYLDTESISVDEQRLRDEIDAPEPEEAMMASEDAENKDPIRELYRRYGASYTRKLLGLDQRQTVSPEYLECCYQQQYHRAKAFEAYTRFLRCASQDEVVQAHIVWCVLEQLTE
ncbi:MAG: hypothetical protein AAF632_28065 [Bacteroidota bacterium]